MRDAFAKVVERAPDGIAVGDDRRTITYRELLRASDELGQRLLTPGVVVLVALPGGVDFTTVQLACFGAGAIFVPIPHESTQREAAVFVEIVQPDVVIVASREAQAPVLAAAGGAVIVALDEPLPERPVEKRANPFTPETRSIQFTSGSTGRPKGILLANASWLATLEQNREHLSQFTGEHVFCPLPQFHAMGNAVVIEHVFHGSPIHLANDFSPAGHVARLQQYRCTAILASPNYFKLMVRLGAISAKELPHLRSFTIGTAAIDESLIRDLRGLFPDVAIYCRYGLSESVGAMVRLRLGPGDQLPQKGLIGRPVPGVELCAGLPPVGAAEPGELKVKSGANAIGVLTGDGVHSLLDADGYLPTGDLAFLTADGQLVVRGRISSFLKSNGYRINPFEIEELLRSRPGVQEAVVVGVPDPMAGQRIIACIEPAPNQPAPEDRELLAACAAELSPYKVPQGVLTLSPLPRTPAGKPDRAAILAAATEWATRAAETPALSSTGSLDTDVLAIVRRAISENVGRTVMVEPDDDLADYLDSLAMVGLVVMLQEQFDLAIPTASLTPENFASVNKIVAFLRTAKEGNAFASAEDVVQAAPSRAPNRNLLMTLVAFVVLLAAFTRAPSDAKGPLTMREFFIAKASCVACADLVLAGSSQTEINFSPTAMERELPGRKVMNEGFSTQPYNPEYLDLLEAALAKSPRRAILLQITPVSLVMRESDDEASYALELRGQKSELRATIDHVRELLHSRTPCEFLFGACGTHTYEWLYPNGWAAQVYTGVGKTDGVANASRFMRRWSELLHYSRAGYQHVLDRVRKWRHDGITVYALRAPVPPAMREAELAMPGYDEPAMIQSFADAGAIWLTVDPDRYVSFDGWHMERDIAEQFSRDVARAIASREQEAEAH